MQMCQPHWEQLRTAVEGCGLGHLVARNPEALADKLDAEHRGEPDEETFDPLVTAMFAVYTSGLTAGGLYLMTKKPDGSEYCPLCELDDHGGDGLKRRSPEWIEVASFVALKKARELGLAPQGS